MTSLEDAGCEAFEWLLFVKLRKCILLDSYFSTSGRTERFQVAESKQHGRRRATVEKRRGRRRAVNQTPDRMKIGSGKVLGMTIAASGIVLSLAAPSMAAAPLTDIQLAASISSVIIPFTPNTNFELTQAASNLSTQLSTAIVKADDNAQVSFARESVTSTRSLDGKLEKIMQDKLAADKLAADKAADEKVKLDEKLYASSANSAPVNRTQALSTPTVTKGTLSAPLRSLVEASQFGPRVNPITGESGEIHTGLDFAAQCGTEVIASAGGTVVFAEWHQYGGGNRVEIDHGNGVVTSYNHLESSSVKVGQKLERGDVIAKVGTTGSSTGCHLHFEVLLDDVKVDPKGWL